MRFRRSVAIVLCLCFVGATVFGGVPVQAASGGEYLYEVHDGKATITGCTWSNASYLEIPRVIDGYPVVAVGANAFQNRNDLLGVIVSEGIETIDYRAFLCCRNLSWAVLPDSLTTIGDEAFSVCQSLQSVDLGMGLKTIGYAAFAYCSNMFDAELPNGLEEIGASAFYKCYALESVILPDSLKTLGARAYDSCVYLNDFYIPETVTSVGANVLYETGCYRNPNYWHGDVLYMGSYLMQAKKTISGNYGVLSGTRMIADGAFINCDNLTEIYLPDSLQIIGASAFQSCTGLQTVTIPGGVITIGDEAFKNCKALTGVQFSGSVTNFGQDVFAGTPYYQNADNWDDNVFYVDNCLVACKATLTGAFQVRPGTEAIGEGALQGQKKLTEVILPDSVTTIGANAFQGCTGLKSITFGKALTQIGTGAFAQCTSLENILVEEGNPIYRSQNNCLIQDKTLVMGCKTSEIPLDGSVTTIGPYAFEGCAGLQELRIPDTITRIEEGAFRHCNYLTNVKLGNGVKVVGKRAFSECDALANIDLGQSVQTIEDFGFAYNQNITKLKLPASLEYLGEEVFSNSTGLENIHFQEGLLSIGKNCFAFCENLTTVHLPNSLKTIDYGGFYSCEKLSDLTMGAGLITIGDTAFDGCAIKTLTIPDSVQTIGSHAFYECTQLQQVHLGQVKKIGYGAFESCSSLKQIHIPATVAEMGKQIFMDCRAMEQMTVDPQNPYYHSNGNCIIRTDGKLLVFGCKNSVIPTDGSVTALDNYCFAGHTGLKSIQVPDPVITIRAYAFYGCSKLEFMQLPFVGNSRNGDNYLGYIFGGSPSQNDLYVPATLTRVVITGGVNVGDSGFQKCKGLREIVLPESIVSIGYSAFANCPQLDRVIAPGELQTIKAADIFQNSPNAKLYINAASESTRSLVECKGIPYTLGGMITFLDEKGGQLESSWYFFGAKLAVPDTPEGYTWVPVPEYCTGNQTIRLRNAQNSGGDLTGDQEINNQDVEYLLWHTLFPHTYPVETNADFNSDGKINNLDVEYLLWHTLFPESYPV